MIRLKLANYELVKCCLLYYRQVNIYNQIKAGSLFYSPEKNCRWPVKTVPLREFSVRSLRTYISLNYSIVNYCAIAIISDYFLYFIHSH